jgi:excisionase family DNA binding protein
MKAPVVLVELVKDAIRDPSIHDEFKAILLAGDSRPANESIVTDVLADAHAVGTRPSRPRDFTQATDEASPKTDLASLVAIVGDLSKQVEGLSEAVAGHLPLVDLKTAAGHLGVSTRTLRRMVAADEIPYRRFGRTLRFSLTLLAPKVRRGPRASPPHLRQSELLPEQRRRAKPSPK